MEILEDIIKTFLDVGDGDGNGNGSYVGYGYGDGNGNGDGNGYGDGSGNDDGNGRKMLFISQIQLIRFHDKTAENEEITNDESSTETPAKDSIQRGDDTPGPKSDTLRRRVSGGQHGLRPIPIDSRNGVHRMDAGPTRN